MSNWFTIALQLLLSGRRRRGRERGGTFYSSVFFASFCQYVTSPRCVREGEGKRGMIIQNRFSNICLFVLFVPVLSHKRIIWKRKCSSKRTDKEECLKKLDTPRHDSFVQLFQTVELLDCWKRNRYELCAIEWEEYSLTGTESDKGNCWIMIVIEWIGTEYLFPPSLHSFIAFLSIFVFSTKWWTEIQNKNWNFVLFSNSIPFFRLLLNCLLWTISFYLSHSFYSHLPRAPKIIDATDKWAFVECFFWL